jgi:hypothetical protein
MSSKVLAFDNAGGMMSVDESSCVLFKFLSQETKSQSLFEHNTVKMEGLDELLQTN